MNTIDNYIHNTYINYDERVRTFLYKVYSECKNNNESLSNYFYVMFDLLANQLKLYYLALDAIDAEKKVSSQDDYKRVSKNPAIAVLNHSHQEIINIMQKLSLSPFDKAKLKRVQNGEDEDSEELLDKLIN